FLGRLSLCCLSCSNFSFLLLLLKLLLHLTAVTDELLGRREFAKLVADHVLSHEDVHERLAIVHAEGKPDELRWDLGAAGPRLNNPRATGFLALNLLEEFEVHVGSFLE